MQRVATIEIFTSNIAHNIAERESFSTCATACNNFIAFQRVAILD